jgi:hypothetical protein
MNTILDGSSTANSSSPLKRGPPCSRCRQKKIRCDKQQPCDQCKRGAYHCVYDENPDNTEDGGKYAALQNRIVRLEAQLKAVTSGQPTRGRGSASETDESPLDCSCGRQIFNTNFSIHYDSGIHWVDLFPTVGHSTRQLRQASEV